MSDQTTARALLKSGRRFRITVIVLVALSLFGLRSWWLLAFAERARIRVELARQDQRLYEEFLRYRHEQGVRLAFFPPLVNPGEAAVWTRQIETHFDHPVAAFWMRDSILTWVQKPESPEVQRWVGEQLGSHETQEDRAFERIGMLLCWYKMHVTTSGEAFTLWVVQRTPDVLRWGVVFPDDQNWAAFFRNLFSPQSTGRPLYEPFWMLRTGFAFPRSGMRRSGTGMRVHLNDGSVFTTVELDTTTDSLQVRGRHQPGRDYFAGPHSPSYQHARLVRRNGWILAALPLLLIIPLYIDYRTIRSLTAHNGR